MLEKAGDLEGLRNLQKLLFKMVKQGRTGVKNVSMLKGTRTVQDEQERMIDGAACALCWFFFYWFFLKSFLFVITELAQHVADIISKAISRLHQKKDVSVWMLAFLFSFSHLVPPLRCPMLRFLFHFLAEG